MSYLTLPIRPPIRADSRLHWFVSLSLLGAEPRVRVAVLAVAVDQVDAEVDLPPEGADGDGVAVDGIVLQDEAEGIATLQISRINRRRLLVAAGEGEDASDGRHGGSKRRSRRAG